MEEEWSHMTEKMLNLTLEIIYLLTGENYIAFKLSSGFVASNLMKGLSPFVDPPSHSLIRERKNSDKVQEAISKIIELLTGEVPTKYQDVTSCISMEEWEYLEGHKELYKDDMMASQPSLTLPSDGSSNRNPPERCPHPLYSRDSTQDHQEIAQEDQDETLINIKEEAEDPYVRDDEPWKEEEVPPEISTDGHQSRKPTKRYLTTSSDVEDIEVTYDSSEEKSIAVNVQPILHTEDPLSDPTYHNSSRLAHHTAVLCPQYAECFIERAKSIQYQNARWHGQVFSCWLCAKSFSQKSDLKNHEKGHAAEQPYSCFKCGKRFSRKSSLSTHEKLHSGAKPYSCTQCGKSFTDKSILAIHQRIHTSEKPFACSECGKCFAQSGNLSAHRRIHTGVKPFSCSDCGELFSRKSSLVRHKKLHTGEKPFSCLECGKGFIQRVTLLLHQRTHTGDRPHPCPECGKQFARKTSMVAHLNSHRRGELPSLGYSS